MLKVTAKRVGRAGRDILRATDARRWSHTVEDYHPIQPRPRWGHGSPPNPHLQRTIERGRVDYERALDDIGAQREALHRIPLDPPTGATEPRPYWNNTWFTSLDAASLVGFLLARTPARYIEIGSGHSTVFARYAIESGALPTSLTSIDPQPRREINAICDRAIRQPLERCDPSVFDEIRPGDILFFDGSHRVFTNSDVTTFFLDILPRLPAGVLVHVHDIFLPADYPPEWSPRLYSEQYLLAAMLLCEPLPFRIVLPNYFVTTDPDLSGRVRRIFAASDAGHPDIPLPAGNLLPDTGVSFTGVSFWFETLERPTDGV